MDATPTSNLSNQNSSSNNNSKQENKMAPSLKRLSLRRSRTSEGMMETLTQSMEAFPHEERVQYSCLKVMRHILLPDDGELAELALDEVLHDGVSKESSSDDDLGVATTTTTTVQWMGMDQSATLALILRAMEGCPDSAQVHGLAVEMLTDLCEASSLSVCDALIELGGLIRLSETMTYHRRLPVARKAIRLHTKLSQFLASSAAMESFSTLSMESKEEDSSL